MSPKRPTVADIRAMKGKYQYSMLRVETVEELEAAQKAGIDMVSVPPEMMLLPHFREIAPSLFSVPGVNFFEVGTADDFVRWAFKLYKASADAVYCSASLATVRRLADEAIPVIGHVGLIPSRATWTGGFKAVGKTAQSAQKVFEAVKAYEAAGAFGVEVESFPRRSLAPLASAQRYFWLAWAREVDATASISSPTMFLAKIVNTCRATPRSTAISQSNSTGCSANVSPPSRNLCRTFVAASIPSSVTR